MNLEFMYLLLIWFLIFYFMFNVTYLFSVMCLVFWILLLMLVSFNMMIYLKFLIILVYVSGIVVSIMYISCMCWNNKIKLSKFFFLFVIFNYMLFDSGISLKFSDVGEFFWMYLFFSFLFSCLVTIFSLNLFKVAGSLRF